MKTKRKTKVGTGGVIPVVEGRPSGREGDTTGEENFVPVEMIALDQLALLTPMEEIESIKFLPDESTPRFFVIRLKDGGTVVELSEELSTRAAELRLKHAEEQYLFTRNLMVIMKQTRRPKQGSTLDEDLVWLAGGDGQLKSERILQAASLSRRIRESLTEPVIEMQRLPLRSKERDKAAKRLKRMFANAIDSVNNPEAKLLDGRALSIEVDTPQGRIQKDVALVAIETAREYVANPDNHFEEPSKGELSAEIIRRHPKAFKTATADYGYWGKIWKKAGLIGLKQKEQGS